MSTHIRNETVWFAEIATDLCALKVKVKAEVLFFTSLSQFSNSFSQFPAGKEGMQT